LVRVTQPNGFENWFRGTTRQIKWDFSEAAGETVKIALAQNGIVVRVLAYSRPIGTAGHGSFSWTIPSDIAPAGNYRIRVSINGTNPVKGDNSNSNFAIRGGNRT
jgi:hypothetical protein